MPGLADLLSVLDLERLEDNLFRGQPERSAVPRTFGGLVVAQALVAASRTVENRLPHSLHAYFILPGDAARPIVYEVERIRDGGSFTTRRCIAIQDGRRIFALSASFQAVQDGFDHQIAAPEVGSPDAITSPPEHRGEKQMPRFGRLFGSFEVRSVDWAPSLHADDHVSVERSLWVRTRDPMPDDWVMHRAVLAYLSDFGPMATALRPYQDALAAGTLQVASLDHMLWFHRPFRIDDWVLMTFSSPSASAGRGFSQGRVFTRSGALVASLAQEGLMRLNDNVSKNKAAGVPIS